MDLIEIYRGNCGKQVDTEYLYIINIYLWDYWETVFSLHLYNIYLIY